jgi:hypothetical protein
VTLLPATSPLHPPTAAERWRQVPRRWRGVMILAAAVVLAYFASSLLGGLYNPPSGSAVGPSSSTETSASGTAAMAQLLSDRHHSVQELTLPISAGTIPTNGTLFVLNPASSIITDVPALRRYLNNGGRLVLGGKTGTKVLQAILGTGPFPVWQSLPSGNAHPIEYAPEDAGVDTVIGGPSGSWQLGDENRFGLLLQGSGGALAIKASVGNGTLVLLASTSSLQNRFLAQADDAAFALDLAGPVSASVIFDEYDHGLGRSGTGLAGLPSHWKAGLLLAVLAALVWMWSAARRFGPPQSKVRELIPSRVAHVDAMAGLLASGGPDRLAIGASSLQDEGRERLRRILRADSDASDEQLIELAAIAGVPSLTPELAADLLRTPRSEHEVIAEGRAFAALARQGSQRWTR